MRSALPLALLLVASCLPTSPGRKDAVAYAELLQPLLDENGLLADRVLEVASGVYNGTTTPDQALEVWSRDITPLAVHLLDQAALVQPPTTWAPRHEELVDIWTARADAYRSLDEAAARHDLDRWRDGRARADQAMLDEERWFRDINRDMEPHGLAIDQFP